MKVINLFGPPGSGKSTTAAGVFHKLKCEGRAVELVTEYAKDMVWENRANILDDQLYIFAKQRRRLERLRGKVDYVVTDSPLLLSAVYGKLYTPDALPEEFYQLVDRSFRSYDNLNLYLNRVKPYSKIGRLQDEKEADDVASAIFRYLMDRDEFTVLDGDEGAVERIIHRLNVEEIAKPCGECGVILADFPSTLCPGCEAYQEHQA